MGEFFRVIGGLALVFGIGVIMGNIDVIVEKLRELLECIVDLIIDAYKWIKRKSCKKGE